MELNERIKSLLKYAYNNCPYYRESFNLGLGCNYVFDDITYEDFLKIPLLTRNEVVINTRVCF